MGGGIGPEAGERVDFAIQIISLGRDRVLVGQALGWPGGILPNELLGSKLGGGNTRMKTGVFKRPQWSTPLGRRCRYTRDEGRSIMDALPEKLDGRLREWKPETAAEARERITEVIELADHDILDIARSRAAEQEVLDLLDEPPTR